ncbi:MAG: T9SS type A sorting domain-containing protein [Flavobacteriales bacterium]|nr:T9SS type A sorting domain-containing protein [Flavobacteriales bacterium]
MALRSQELRSPESIVWDEDRQRYLVSNTIDALIRSVDLRGNTAILSRELSGSHGLLLKENILYSCYRNELHVYDVHSDQPIVQFVIEGAKFLNGICEDEKGNIYITDFSTRRIFKLRLGSDLISIENSETWKTMESIPNGIAYDELRDELVVVSWGSDASIYCIDRQTASIKHKVETGFGNLESIVIDDRGDAYVSSWTPSAILKFDQGVRTVPHIWKSEDIYRPTGLTIGKDNDIIHLSAEESTLRSLERNAELETKLDAFPNPMSVNSLISYKLEESGYVNISIYDCRGNLVQTLITEMKKAGNHQFMYERDQMSNGLYFINMISENDSQAIAVTLVD